VKRKANATIAVKTVKKDLRPGNYRQRKRGKATRSAAHKRVRGKAIKYDKGKSCQSKKNNRTPKTFKQSA